MLFLFSDDPLSCVTAFEMAVEWRQKFQEDCIIDLICYRRYGHNELDQPMYTQPQMYAKILKHPDTLAVYEKQLMADGTCEQKDIDTIKKMVNDTLDREFESSKKFESPKSDWLGQKWSGFKSPLQQSRVRETGYDIGQLKEIGIKMSTLPETLNVHKQLGKIFSARRETVEKGEGLDWATAEALAIGTLLLEGNHVRLSGQDVQRGTFSHRHAVIKDQMTGESYTPLNHLRKYASPIISRSKTQAQGVSDIQAEFVARNSILSEFGVLGFEMGYSLENPNTLVCYCCYCGGGGGGGGGGGELLMFAAVNLFKKN